MEILKEKQHRTQSHYYLCNKILQVYIYLGIYITYLIITYVIKYYLCNIMTLFMTYIHVYTLMKPLMAVNNQNKYSSNLQILAKVSAEKLHFS